MLGAFYQHLLAPVEAHLAGATEVLIIPHKELFDVPWAALFDSQTGQYLIQRFVLRVAPSLRVARTAADTLRDKNSRSSGAEEKGHALVVGNPLPTREAPLPKAEVEAEFVAELLSGVGFEVHALMGQAATKADVQSKIEGAKWAHLACHGAFGKKALMLAEKKNSSSSGKKHTLKPKKGRKETLKIGAGFWAAANAFSVALAAASCSLAQGTVHAKIASWSLLVMVATAVCVCINTHWLLFPEGMCVCVCVCARARAHVCIHMHWLVLPACMCVCVCLCVCLCLSKRRAGEEEEDEEEEESSEADLTMEEVQGSVRMGAGSTVVLSACNSGLGEIRAEGVVGLSRGFLFAGAAATVVSLWSVDDGSTAALMKQMYKHLKDGRTTAQALRLAMLHLLNGPAESGWRRPLYWAAFLVVGANTRLPGV